MARSKKTTGKINFELGLGGMAAVAISALCVLLWVFVLGFWVGQKMVGKRLPANEISLPTASPLAETPRGGDVKKDASPLPETDAGGQGVSRYQPEPQPRTQAETSSSRIIEEKITEEKPDTSGHKQAQARSAASRPAQQKAARSHHALRSKKAGATYFVLQIASYRKRDRANKEAARWARKGYFTRVKQADLGAKRGLWYRVYLGKFDSMRKARALAVRLADTEDLKSYIVPLKE